MLVGREVGVEWRPAAYLRCGRPFSCCTCAEAALRVVVTVAYFWVLTVIFLMWTVMVTPPIAKLAPSGYSAEVPVE